MASTYTLISANTLSSSAASVTFSAIPATYTDLVLRVSARGTGGGLQTRLTFNGDTSAIYSSIYFFGYSSNTGSLRQWYANYFEFTDGNSNSDTSNTFGSDEIYMPSYLAGGNKPFSVANVRENNSATSWTVASMAGLWRSTSAITSITLTPNSGLYATDSSFYLYGIKNS